MQQLQLVRRNAESEELLRGARPQNAGDIELALVQEKARELQTQIEQRRIRDEMDVIQSENIRANAELQENILGNQGNAQRIAREIRNDVGMARDEVRVVGNQVAVVGENVNQGFARMDEGFIAMNGHFAQLNMNLRSFARTSNSCFDILNFESIPRTIIKFFSCILAFFLLLLNLARLAFNILREVRNIFYNVLQDATSAVTFKLDVAIKWAMLLVELNFYCLVVQTVGVFFGIKRLDIEIVIKLGDLSVSVLNFLYAQIVAAITGSTLRELGGIFKEKLKEADAIKQVLNYINMTKLWINDYIEITKQYFRQEAAAAAKEAAAAAAKAGKQAALDTASAAATGALDTASAAATGAYDAAASVASRVRSGLGFGGGRSILKYGDFELQEFGFLNTTNDTRCLKLASSIFDYMKRNIQNPDDALIDYVSNPQVQERMRIIQRYCSALFGPQKGGRKTHRRKRSKRIKIRSKKYN